MEVEENAPCAYCRQSVDPPRTPCLRCAAVYHADCWAANDERCAVYGCEPAPTLPAPPVEAPGGAGWRITSGLVVAILFVVLSLNRCGERSHRKPRPIAVVASAPVPSSQWEDDARRLNVLREEIRGDPTNAELFLQKAAIHEQRGQFIEAMADVTKAVELRPDLGPAWRRRASLKVLNGDREGGLVDYTQAIALLPDDPSAYWSRGNLLLRMGAAESAAADFSRVIDLGDHRGDAHHERSRAWAFQGKSAEALTDLDEALRLQPGMSAWLYERGCLRYDTRSWEAAIEDFKRVFLHDGPLRDLAKLRLELSRMRQGLVEGAKQDLRSYDKLGRRTDADPWRGALVQFLAGLRTEEQLWAALPRQTLDVRGEACFYAGAKKLIEGDREKARRYFLKCLESDLRGSAEYQSAAAELEAMK